MFSINLNVLTEGDIQHGLVFEHVTTVAREMGGRFKSVAVSSNYIQDSETVLSEFDTDMTLMIVLEALIESGLNYVQAKNSIEAMVNAGVSFNSNQGRVT